MKEITATTTKGWQKYKKESWMRRKRKEREKEGTQEGVRVGYLKGKTARWETKGKLGRGTCEGREKERGRGERAHTDTMRQVEWVPVRGESEGRETKRQVGRDTGKGREQQGRDTIRHEGGVP